MKYLIGLAFCASALAQLPKAPPVVLGGSGGGGGGSGTVTSVGTGCGLTGGPVTASGTLAGTGPCYAAGGGTAQAQTATYSPAVTSLAAGLTLSWLPSNANTSAAPTFSPNGLTAEPIVKVSGAALVANDLTTTAIAVAVYNSGSTHWELQNPQTVSTVPVTSITSLPANTVLCNNTGSTANAIACTPGQVFAMIGPTPSLGTDGSVAGTLQLANAGAAFHGILGSAATANNTTLLFATAPVTGDLIDCIVSSTTCTLTDTGVLASSVVVGPASVTSGHIATFNGTTGKLIQDGGAVPTGTVTSIATTGPITGGTITTSGTIACATCVTSAAALTNLGAIVGAGLQASQASSQLTVANLGTAGTEIWTMANAGLTTTPAGGYQLLNSTQSTSGATVQVSPPFLIASHAWKSTATAADQLDCWRAYGLPVSGTSTTTEILDIGYSINVGASCVGATYTTALRLNTANSTSLPLLTLAGLTAGLGVDVSNNLNLWSGGASAVYVNTGILGIASSGTFGWCNTTNAYNCSGQTFLSSPSAAIISMGKADAAAPVAQTLGVQNVVAGTSNTAGQNWTLTGSRGTGTGAGGSIIFQTAAAGSTGSTQNSSTTALTIDSTQSTTIVNALIPSQQSTTGQRYVCITTTGQLVSSAAACVGT